MGTPLKDWDIQINYGIKTGANDAFVISTEQRNEILSNCLTEQERERTEELIRPILRGRDIKRYGYEWADLYLIATFPSRKYDIEDFPSVKKYLLSFAYQYLIDNNNEWIAKHHLNEYCEQKLAQNGEYIIINGSYVYDEKGKKEKGRKKTSNKWFETQDSISYWEDFSLPKIVYREIGFEMDACIVPDGWFINNKLYLITGKDIEYLITLLNSRIFNKIYLASANLTGGKGVDFMETLLLPNDLYLAENLKDIYSKKNIDSNFEDQIDTALYAYYKLSENEIAFLNMNDE